MSAISEALLGGLRAAAVPYTEQEPLAAHTTFRIGGVAACLAAPEGMEQLLTVLRLWREAGDGCPLFMLGRGSNLLCADSGFPGLVVSTRGVRDVRLTTDENGGARLYVGCGAPLAGLSRLCAEASPALSGLEFACGIPGTVGGAVVMNAGAYGGEIGSLVLSSRYLDTRDGSIRTLTHDEHDFSYRHSIYQEHPSWVLLDAELCLAPGDATEIKATMASILSARQQKQPLEHPSAGSVFRRPTEPGRYVGQMVEACGLKGFAIGDAQISEKHAGFIINKGHATAREVRRLICHIQSRVWEEFHIRLEPELCFVGEDDPPEEGGRP